ncbi:MAG: hypothetical protein H0W90_12005 [Actinobacteria bacterium]|nr:hypothetical protein [Actinomycetota bacterium]
MQEQDRPRPPLTPAGEQVERALAQGKDIAAFNLYRMNIREDEQMTVAHAPEDDDAAAWHGWMQEQIGWADAEVQTDDDAEMLDDFTPSLQYRTIRNEAGVPAGLKDAVRPTSRRSIQVFKADGSAVTRCSTT